MIQNEEIIQILQQKYPNHDKSLINDMYNFVINKILTAIEQKQNIELRGFGRIKTHVTQNGSVYIRFKQFTNK